MWARHVMDHAMRHAARHAVRHAVRHATQELPRTVDHNPRTTTYLWHVDIQQALHGHCMGTAWARALRVHRMHAARTLR